MADGVGNIGPQGVCLGQIFTVKLLSGQVPEGLALQRGAELSQARRVASPVTRVWREPEVSPESVAIQVLLRS